MKNLRIFLIGVIGMMDCMLIGEPIKSMLGSEGVEHGGAKPYKHRVEFLESTGMQWIDTGVIGSNTTRVECEFGGQFNNKRLYGARHNYGGQQFEMILYDNSTYGILVRYDGGVDNHSFAPIVNYQRYKTSVDADALTVDGQAIPIKKYTAFTTPGTMILFGYRSGSYIGDFCKARVYTFRVYKNGVLVLSFIPVIDNSDEPCMYDEVSGKLFYNQGSGQFIAGPIVE